MARSRLTSVARLPLALIRHVDQFGIDPEEILRLAGITVAHRRNPDSRVSLETLLKLWHAVLDRVSGDQAVGIRLGESLQVKELGLVGYTMYYSATLGDALTRLLRYSQIVSLAADFDARDAGDRIEIVLGAHPLLEALRHPSDTRLGFLVGLVRELTGYPLRPIEVRFTYPRPPNLADHRRVLGSNLVFDQPQTVLVVSKNELDVPIEAADETVAGYLDTLAERIKTRLGWDQDFASRVRRAIWSELSGGNPTRRNVAHRLGLGVASLYRQLRREDTTFEAVRDDLRKELANELLGSRRLAIEEIAFLLGYAEASTFSRAFRRWEGISPQKYRASRRGAHAGSTRRGERQPRSEPTV